MSTTAKKNGKKIDSTNHEFPTDGCGTVVEVARFLKMTTWAVYRMVQAGSIPKAMLPGSAVRIPWSAVRKMAEGGVKSVAAAPASNQS